jgi:formamidopyrimidine-DNA glycosylase
LGRLRLIAGDPLLCEPISKLGFDPLQNLPDLDDFTTRIGKRAVPIKALLLDQAFSA